MQTVLLWAFILVQTILLVLLVRILIRVVPIIFLLHKPLPYVPSQKKVIRAIIQSGVLDEAKTIVDLGAGTGYVLSQLAKHYPQAKLYGVEIQRSVYWLSKLYTARFGKRIQLTHDDMFAYSIRNADAIVGFWIPSLMPRLLEKFTRECKPGCVIVSNMFPLPDNKIFTEKAILVGEEVFYVYRNPPR